MVSDTSERGQLSENLLSIERAWHSILAWANQSLGSRQGCMWITHGRSAYMHTNGPLKTWYISEHGEELIRPHPVSLFIAVEQESVKGQTHWSGWEDWQRWESIWHRGLRGHCQRTPRNPPTLGLLPFPASCYQTKCPEEVLSSKSQS